MKDNQNRFNELREKYQEFIYEDYDISFADENLNIKFHFSIPNLTEFHPEIKIKKEYIKTEYNEDYLDYLVFQIGLIELISYYKCTCPKKIIVKANYINNEQISWLKKLYYNGLGEFLYTNNIRVDEDKFFDITCTHEEIKLPNISYQGSGNLICVGGGKDSCVSLEILKNENDNSCFIINGKTASLNTALTAGYTKDNIIDVERVLDREIVKLNEEGYLNGHTPFSSIVAFISYLVAYLQGKENIILSNESSANEPTVIGTNINHQYSKTYEFECDFMNYMNKFIKLDIKYFSLLRGLSEFNIARLFAHYKKYHKVFKSCNVGSKEKEWIWCCNCSKCLFVYMILTPFLTKEERLNIFGEELYEKELYLETFKEILGYSDTKPFDCVGTFEEARYATSLAIEKWEGTLPYLLKYYQDNYPLELDGSEILSYNEENNLSPYYENLVKEELNKYV